MTGFVAVTKEEAKRIIDERGSGKMIVLFVDYDRETDDCLSLGRDVVTKLINKANTIIFNEDTFVPQIQLWSIKQELEDMKRKGTMHDVLISPM